MSLTNQSPGSAVVRSAQVVLPAEVLDETVNFFTERLGFRVDAIFPADAPSVAMLSGHGLVIRLQPPDGRLTPGTLRVMCTDPDAFAGGFDELVAPNGTVVQLIDVDQPMPLPPVAQTLVVATMADAHWGVGRAGMQYRDIIPGRQGGRFIGSHIRIPGGGPVPDYVHYHKVRFQMIYCHKGWVRLVYEDQGESFVLNAGDCVLQPPEIRHRVLESGDDLEVIELGCPAEHETLADHDMALPTGLQQTDRDFGGQRFVRHVAATAAWNPWRVQGFEHRDIGIGQVSDGLAGVRVVRPVGDAAGSSRYATHDGEFVFLFVLAGSVTFQYLDDADVSVAGHALTEGDTVVVPAGLPHRLVRCSGDLELLDVTLPADIDLAIVAGR